MWKTIEVSDSPSQLELLQCKGIQTRFCAGSNICSKSSYSVKLDCFQENLQRNMKAKCIVNTKGQNFEVSKGAPLFPGSPNTFSSLGIIADQLRTCNPL